jgi:hypothetical protein
MASVLEGIPSLLPVNVAGPAIGAYSQARQQGQQQDQIDFKKAQEVSSIVSRAAQLADTPEKWAHTIGVLQKHFPSADLSAFQDFGSRDTVLAQLRDPYKDAELDISRQNLEINRAKLAQGGTDNVGLTPIPGTDAQGNPQYALPSRTGKAVPLTFPDGFTISKEPIKVDTPTETILLDPITRQPIGRIPKDVAGAARATAVGTAQGGAQAQLPAALTDAERTLGQIDDLIKAPGLGGITGGPFNLAINQFKPDWQMSPEERDALTRINQLQGGAFLQARQLLKGGGQITDFEGRKAEDAMTRMSRALSKEDFVKALNDFKDAVQSGVAKLKATAGGASALQPPTGVPAAPAAPAGPVDFRTYFGSP